MQRNSLALLTLRRLLQLAAIVLCLQMAKAPRAAAADTVAPRSPTAAVQQLFADPGKAASLFSPVVLAKASPDQLSGIAKGLLDKYGAYQGVIYSQGKYVIELEKALVYATVVFDPKGLMAGFQIARLVPKFATLDDAIAAFNKLPGEASIVVEKSGKDIASIRPDAVMSVGSAFKLAVLNALIDAVHDGRLSWTQDVKLQSKWRALPTGVLQDWPEGMNFTVQALAGLMISLSDNTATDAIMDLVGSKGLEKYAESNRPFLAPREFFVLAGYRQSALRDKFLKSSPQDREAMLPSINAQALPDVGELLGADTKAIEWHFSVHDLCRLIGRVHDTPVLHINPGVAIPQEWSEVAFKGGGDHGVLNLTTWLKDGKGDAYCVSATWNDNGDLKNAEMERPYTGLIALLHDKAP